MQLSGIDLNLLVVLGALLETESVKDASRRLGLSASATSHALSRLRDLLDDPVLVRAGQRMVASARARELRPRVQRLLDDVSDLLSASAPFDPASVRRGVRISSADFLDRVLLEPLSAELSRSAPGLDLFVIAPGGDYERLRQGDIELAVGVYSTPPPDLRGVTLTRDRMVCVMRGDHPLAGQRLTLKRYLSVPHVLTSPRGGTRAVVDQILDGLGKTRRVARTAPTFGAALRRLLDTDYLVTLPEGAVRGEAEDLGLFIAPVPLELGPFEYSLLWHRRNDTDATLAWLVSRFVEFADRLA